MSPNTTDTLSFYEDEKNLKKLCDFLRSSEGPAVREAIEMDKRVYYLKGRNEFHAPYANNGIWGHAHYFVFLWLTFHHSLFQSSTGEKLVNFMVEPKKGTKWPKDLPRFKTRQEAIAVCKELCNYQYMHRSIKRGKGDLVVSVIRMCSLFEQPLF